MMESNNTQSSKFKKVCVFCGSKSGNKKAFSDAALDLENELVRRRKVLVYGGGSVGLKGLISQKVYDGGCLVLGVIPTVLVPVGAARQIAISAPTARELLEKMEQYFPDDEHVLPHSSLQI